jgi:hypothetical protein
MSTPFTHHPSSFRDPSGFIFEKDGVLYRQVNTVFKEDFELFNSSGLYKKLVQKNLLISHEVIGDNLTNNPEWLATLKPERLNIISYPYEWTFDMLRDAALLTLRITKESIASGMILKDATPYNIQWQNGKLIFIDSLSFEKYDESKPWIAYRQFCENFLAPLLLMHYSKIELSPMLLAYPEGVPLNLASSMLPWRTRLSLHIYLHIHLHAGMAKRKPGKSKQINFSRQKLENLITSLEILIRKLKPPVQHTAWSAYYEEASQRSNYLEDKKRIISQWLIKLSPLNSAADLGANNGEFSRLLAARNIPTLAADSDPYCINALYNEIKSKGEKFLHPLVIDLANPSPAIGANNEERQAFTDRINVDLILALALIHHMAIGRNLPFERIASFFGGMGKYLIIEFVPKMDPKVQLMLTDKKDIYSNYDQSHFEQAFSRHFSISARETVAGSNRTLYLMTRHADTQKASY